MNAEAVMTKLKERMERFATDFAEILLLFAAVSLKDVIVENVAIVAD